MDADELARLSPEGAAKSYRCPSCNGEMGFDPATQKMRCGHCGTTIDVPAEQGIRNIVEYDLQKRLMAPRGLGTQVRTTRCQECGASVSFAANVTATKCEFCGSSQVLPQEENRNLVRPESLVPFRLDQKAAQEKFGHWVRKLWFRPSDLKSSASVRELKGIYVPYWAFDAWVASSWTAQAGYHYYVTETVRERDSSGKMVNRNKRVQKTRWEHAWGSRRDLFDDLLVCASRGLPEELADRLKTFDTKGLMPYEPGYLAGFSAEEYAVELNDAWRKGVTKMENVQEQRCGRDVPGDTHRFLNVTNRFSDEKYKHVLLPIYLSAYRYKETIYRFLVNGQTGEVQGKAPWSVVKIVLFILMIAAIITGIVLLIMQGQK